MEKILREMTKTQKELVPFRVYTDKDFSLAKPAKQPGTYIYM